MEASPVASEDEDDDLCVEICEPTEAEVERCEEASDSEAEEDGAGDLCFEFDATGARVRPEEEAAREAEVMADAETRGAAVVAAPERRHRRSRQVEILQQAAGQEHTSEGETRIEQQGQRAQGIFTARAYYWMYYAPGPNRDMEIVKPGERAQLGQCHALLDAAANVDADSVTASNSTYEYAGVDARQPELLFTKTFTCYCRCCRDPSSISLRNRGCPFAESTGRWQQQTVATIQGVARIAAERRVDTRIFGTSMQEQHLYAVFGGYAERGGRPYWLLWCVKAPYPAPRGLKSQDGSTINMNWWIIDAYWFASTSESEGRRSYKLLDDQLVHVFVKSIVQEADLEFERNLRGERVLGDEAHLKIVRHNFSNVVT